MELTDREKELILAFRRSPALLDEAERLLSDQRQTLDRQVEQTEAAE